MENEIQEGQTSSQAASSQETPSQEAPSQAVPPQETPSQETPSQAAPPQETSPQAAPAQEGAKNAGDAQPAQKPKKKRTLLPIVIGAVIVVILALAGAGIYAYNTPAHKLERLLDLGERYLSELDYAQAVVAFTDALEIDPANIRAYAGGIEAYAGTGDAQALQTFYEEAIETVREMEPAQTEENLTYLVDIFVRAEDVYAEDTQKAVDTLKLGYELTDGEESVGESLVSSYGTLADEIRETGDRTRELEIYEEILSLFPDNEQAKGNRKDCVQGYLDELVAGGYLDELQQLIEKYQDLIPEIDFNLYTETLTQLREQEAAKETLMQNVYALMEAGEYVAMTEIDGSEEAETIVEWLEGEPLIFAPSGYTADYTGLGAGLYPYKSDSGEETEETEETEGTGSEYGYYFYYGDYVNGIRQGHGIEFISSDYYYSCYDGEWQNDAPNGQGTVTMLRRQQLDEAFGDYYIVTENVTVKDGLYDGLITKVLQDTYNTGLSFTGTYTAVNGHVSDVWDQYPQYQQTLAQSHVDQIIYVVMENRDVYDDWNYNIWWSYCDPDSLIGLSGWDN